MNSLAGIKVKEINKMGDKIKNKMWHEWERIPFLIWKPIKGFNSTIILSMILIEIKQIFWLRIIWTLLKFWSISMLKLIKF